MNTKLTQHKKNNRTLRLRSQFVAVLLIFLGFSQLAHASGYTNNHNIEIMQQSYGGWIIRLENPANPDSCSKTHILLLPSMGQYNEVYSMLLAAYTANKLVNINVNGCHSAGYMLFSHIYTNWNL